MVVEVVLFIVMSSFSCRASARQEKLDITFTVSFAKRDEEELRAREVYTRSGCILAAIWKWMFSEDVVPVLFREKNLRKLLCLFDVVKNCARSKNLASVLVLVSFSSSSEKTDLDVPELWWSEQQHRFAHVFDRMVVVTCGPRAVLDPPRPSSSSSPPRPTAAPRS